LVKLGYKEIIRKFRIILYPLKNDKNPAGKPLKNDKTINEILWKMTKIQLTTLLKMTKPPCLYMEAFLCPKSHLWDSMC